MLDYIASVTACHDDRAEFEDYDAEECGELNDGTREMIDRESAQFFDREEY